MRSAVPAAAWVAALVAASLVTPAVAQDADSQKPRSIPSNITEDTTLGGRLRMTHDVVVRSGATLRFLPGTTIEVDRDSRRDGWDKLLCELHVVGRLRAAGTAEQPITVTGRRWFGIVLNQDRDRADHDTELRHVRISRAVRGVQISTGSPTFSHCVFDDCDVGISVGNLRWQATGPGTYSEDPSPIVTHGLFVRCKTGVFVERDAAPTVSRCTFVGGKYGVANESGWSGFAVQDFGARVDRGLFTGLEIAVQGPSIVENSIFVRNAVVHEVSDFHGPYSATTDAVAWRGNVLHENQRASRGESDLGHSMRTADPGLVGTPTPDSISLDVTPPPAAALRPDSSIRGTATDGGDPGPLGKPGWGAEEVRWRTRGAPMTAVYVTRSDEETGDVPSARAAGAQLRASGLTWSRFDVESDGAVTVGPFPVVEGRRYFAAYPLHLERAATVTLELNAEGAVAAWIDGARLEGLPARMRFGSRGVEVTRRLDAGPHELIVRLAATEPTSRLGVAVHGSDRKSFTNAPLPAPEAAELELKPVAYRRPMIGFRLASVLHWADLVDPKRAYILRESGERVGLGEFELEFAARGFVKTRVPEGWGDEKLELHFVGVRDPHGTPLGGQPLVIPLDGR